MPSRASKDYFFLEPDWTGELLLRNALLILQELERTCKRGVLYTQEELYYSLKDSGIDYTLKKNGQPGLSLIDRVHGTSLQECLHNLWRHDYIRKTGTAFFGLSGRPTGVHWLIKG